MKRGLILLAIIATGCTTSVQTPPTSQTAPEQTSAIIAEADPVDAEPTADGLFVLRLPGMV